MRACALLWYTSQGSRETGYALTQCAPLHQFGGIACLRWEGGYGSRSKLAKATHLVGEVAEKSEIRLATFSTWAEPPLEMTESARKAAGCTGHTGHVSGSDAMGFIGLHPIVPYQLPDDLKRGFTSDEQRIAGNWRRKADPSTAEPVRRGAGNAIPNGEPNARDDSERVYGRGEGRMSAREQQLRARSRLCRFVECGLRKWGIDRPISDLPKGNADWEIIIPAGDVNTEDEV